MKTVFYQGDFDKQGSSGCDKRIHPSTVKKVLESNLDALKRMGHDTVEEAFAAIENDAVLKMADGSELWQEEA